MHDIAKAEPLKKRLKQPVTMLTPGGGGIATQSVAWGEGGIPIQRNSTSLSGALPPYICQA